MTFTFSYGHHDRAAHLRTTQWRSDDIKVMVIGGEHIGTHAGRAVRWLDAASAPEGEWILLGTGGGQTFAAVIVDRVSPELEPVSLRLIASTLSSQDASLAVDGVGLARWHQNHPRCSRCGARTEIAQGGHTRICPECGAVHFPRTDPAVIMLITDSDDRALLGRQASWPENRFSTLAGFVEPGETLEGAVRREVKEEVSLDVGAVTYAGSQPWPFPSSLMLGFFGTALTTNIRVDEAEIVEARWFTRDELSELSNAGEILTPPHVSISRWLIERWHGGKVDGRW